MTFRFYSVPAWALIDSKEKKHAEPAEELAPAPIDEGMLADVLHRIEYRGWKALDHAYELLEKQSPAVYARSPNDLPALLRTSDQLVTMARVEAGERAQLWRCQKCGTRYAVPVALVRPVSLRCERCDATVELDPSRAEGEENITDPRSASVNTARQELSAFFREAMARGWPVLVAKR
ncbi:MAG: hypothetical protein ACO1OB_09285 [Archangium sp.]